MMHSLKEIKPILVLSASSLLFGFSIAQADEELGEISRFLGFASGFQQSVQRKAPLQWKLGLTATGAKDEQSMSQLIGADGTIDFQKSFSESLNVRFNLKAYAESGSVQTVFEKDTRPSNGFFITEAVADILLYGPFVFRSGLISQSHLKTPLLVDERVFPGAMILATWSWDNFEMQMRAQQAVPTSYTLSSLSDEIEPLPRMGTETVEFNYRRGRFSANAYLTHYRFDDLPSAVATESYVLGNTVEGLSALNHEFAFEYEGLATGIDSTVNFSEKTALRMGFGYLNNLRAAANVAGGFKFFTEFAYDFPTVRLIPGFTVFRNEADTSPASYNSWRLGHNNRQGIDTSLSVVFKNSNLRLGATYTDADVISKSIVKGQSRLQSLLIKLETSYDSF